MKGLTLTTVLFSFVLMMSCSKSGSGTGGGNNGGGTPPFTPNCNGAATSFATDVNPIFQTVCAQSSCHNSGSVNGPGALTDFTLISASKSLIRAAIISGAMPKTGTLTAAQKNSIICWIDAGGANN
ncbi:MAG: hypothetical protein IPK31_10175 [Chitinophagaceae bacterium]|nr:hypothetical protein [Chitinophagaceae bacterium]